MKSSYIYFPPIWFVVKNILEMVISKVVLIICKQFVNDET